MYSSIYYRVYITYPLIYLYMCYFTAIYITVECPLYIYGSARIHAQVLIAQCHTVQNYTFTKHDRNTCALSGTTSISIQTTRPAFAHSHYGRRREPKNPGGIRPGSTWRALCIRAWNCKASFRWEISKPWSSTPTSHYCGGDFDAFHSDSHKLRDVCSSQVRVSNFLILISTL